jgi:hypothetical protein
VAPHGRDGSYGSGSYGLDAYGPDYDGDGFEPAGYPAELDEPAYTPAGGIPVTPREPLDAAGEVGAARAPRPAGRPHESAGSPANRDRSNVRYALEEEPS